MRVLDFGDQESSAEYPIQKQRPKRKNGYVEQHMALMTSVRSEAVRFVYIVLSCGEAEAEGVGLREPRSWKMSGKVCLRRRGCCDDGDDSERDLSGGLGTSSEEGSVFRRW